MKIIHKPRLICIEILEKVRIKMKFLTLWKKKKL